MQQYWITLKSPHHLAPYEWLGRGAGFVGGGRLGLRVLG